MLSIVNFLATSLPNIADPTTYQKDAAFPPDKLALWKHPMDEDGWVHAHNSLRGEIGVMREVLTKLASAKRDPAEWQVLSLQTWWAGHLAHVHDHHSIEDHTYTPYLLTRIHLPAKLTTDHVALVELLDTLDAQFAALSDAKSLRRLRNKWGSYQRAMLPHLREEEAIGLPLLRAFFAPSEFAKIVEGVISTAPPISIGSFVYWMGGSRESTAKFMSNEGIPFFVWYLAFKPALDTYCDEMVKHTDALQSGVPPPPTPSAGSVGWTLLGALFVFILLFSFFLSFRDRKSVV